MQKSLKFFVIILAVLIVAPQITLAAWWNPTSWGWLNSIFHFQKTAQQQKHQQAEDHGQSTINSISSSSGAVGSTIIIKGTDFASTYNEAIFDCSGSSGSIIGAQVYNISSNDGKTITTTVPRVMAGAGVSGSSGVEVTYPINCIVSVNNNTGYKSNSLPFAVTAANSTQTAGWKTYTNSVDGYQMRYPTDFVSMINLTAAQKEPFSTYMSTCTQDADTLCYAGSQKEDGFDVAAVSVNADASISPQDCQKSKPYGPDGEIAEAKQETINGITFYHSHFGEAGLGHYVSTESYRTYYNGKCYTVNLGIETDRGSSGNGNGKLRAVFSDIINSKLKSIFYTFKFTSNNSNSSSEVLNCQKESNKNNCYQDLAVKNKDTSICDKIEEWNEQYTTTSRETCYSNVARAEKDSSVCELIKNTASKNECYMDVAVAIGDISNCQQIVEDGGFRNGCYSGIAADKGDSSVCDYIKEQSNVPEKDYCYVGVSKTSSNQSICDKIKTVINKDQCYKFIAQNKQDPSICQMIERSSGNLASGLDFQDECYYNLALKTKNTSFCDGIRSKGFVDGCKKLQSYELGG